MASVMEVRLVAVLFVALLFGGVRGWNFHQAQEDVIDGCYYQNHRYRGADLPGGPRHVDNYTACQEECQTDAECGYFVHFAQSRECWLAGAGAVYDNKHAQGGICGPKYCPRIPTGCVQLPPSGFPGNSPDETEAMFLAHRQPEKLECWPQNATKGWYDSCEQVTVLEDAQFGWPAKCQGLQRVDTVPDGETCESECVKDVSCSAWVTVNDAAQSCLHGRGVDCFQRVAFPGVLRGQRIMHGEVRVLANLTGVQIMGLQKAFDSNYFIRQEPDAVNACRNDCYSNIECDWWQYSSVTGCWVERPNLHNFENLVEYPITRASWKDDSHMAKFVIAGEYIQHVCPGTERVPVKFSSSGLPSTPTLQYTAPIATPAESMIQVLKQQYPNIQGAPPAHADQAPAGAYVVPAGAESSNPAEPAGPMMPASGSPVQVLYSERSPSLWSHLGDLSSLSLLTGFVLCAGMAISVVAIFVRRRLVSRSVNVVADAMGQWEPVPEDESAQDMNGSFVTPLMVDP